MNKSILILLVLISNLTFAQNYNQLYIEKSRVDKNNTIYGLGKEFLYKVAISDNNKLNYLKVNDLKKFKLTDNIDSIQISEVYLTVIKPKLFQRTNQNQTEIIFSYESKPSAISYTGLVENKRNVWLHPPRQGFFQALETCPFPFIQLKKPVGFKWTDSLNIGDQWSNDLWGQWEGDLLLTYEYEIAAKEKVETNFGKIDCTVVNSKAQSTIGTSYLKAYYSDEFGFVKLEYALFNGMEVTLTLDKVVTGPIFRSGKEFLLYKNQ